MRASFFLVYFFLLSKRKRTHARMNNIVIFFKTFSMFGVTSDYGGDFFIYLYVNIYSFDSNKLFRFFCLFFFREDFKQINPSVYMYYTIFPFFFYFVSRFLDLSSRVQKKKILSLASSPLKQNINKTKTKKPL